MSEKGILNKLQSTELERLLGSTVYSHNKKVMDNFIMENLKNDGSFSIPVIQTIAPVGSNLGKKLIELYDRKVMYADTSGITDEMKILQASAFDGLIVGYNMEKDGAMAIYTANAGAIFGVDSESKFSMDKTLEFNRQGIVNAVRIDVSYTSENGFDFKAVSLNKNTCLKVVDFETGEGRFLLAPYIALQRSMAFFVEMLNDGRILEVTQEVGGLNKVRYITTKTSALAKYSDSEEFAKSLKPEFFPLKGFFYAPVLGADSMTLGRTRIELVNISKIRSVTNPNVEKAQSGVTNMIIRSTIQKYLKGVYSYDLDRYSKIVEKLPKFNEMFGEMSDTPSPTMVMKYYNQLKGKDINKFHDVIRLEFPNILDDMSNIKDIFNTCEMVDVSKLSEKDLRELLKEGIYKIIIRKKDCEYSSMTVTNNKDVLKKLYGNDYFANYESLGARLYELEYRISGEVNKDIVKEALVFCGFDSSDNIINEVENIMSTHDEKLSQHERLALLFKSGETKGKGVRKSSSNDELVLARECFSSLSGLGSLDYYKYVNIKNITSMHRVG